MSVTRQAKWPSVSLSTFHSDAVERQTGIVGDEDNAWTWKNEGGGRSYISALQKYTEDGSTFTYCDNDMNDLTVRGDLNIAEYEYHNGDMDTYRRYQNDQFTDTAGSIDMVDANAVSGSYYAINPTRSSIDTRIYGSSTTLVHAQNSTNNVLFLGNDIGHGTDTPASNLVGNASSSLSGRTLHIKDDVNEANLVVEGTTNGANIILADRSGAANDKCCRIRMDDGQLVWSVLNDDGTVLRDRLFVIDVGSNPSDYNCGVNVTTPRANLHLADTIAQIRLSDKDSASPNALSTMIDFYQGESTAQAGRVGFNASNVLEIRSFVGNRVDIYANNSQVAVFQTSRNIGLNMQTPGQNLCDDASFDLTGYALHMEDTTNQQHIVVEGTGGANQYMIDRSASANSKCLQIKNTSGSVNWRVMNDNGTAAQDNVMVINLADGAVALGTSTPGKDLGDISSLAWPSNERVFHIRGAYGNLNTALIVDGYDTPHIVWISQDQAIDQKIMAVESHGSFLEFKSYDDTLAAKNEEILVVNGYDGRVGVNGQPTDGNLHIIPNSAGAVVAETGSDGIVIENNAKTGLSILTPDNIDGNVVFGSPAQNNYCAIRAGYQKGLIFDMFGCSGSESVSISTAYALALNIGSQSAGVDYQLQFNGDDSQQTITGKEDEDIIELSTFVRDTNADYRRYYHVPIEAINPGATGATWISPTTAHPGGWRLDAASETLDLATDVHDDWNGASDLTLSVRFTVNVDNSGGNANDTVDLKLVCLYKGDGETSCKTQTIEDVRTVGACAQYTQFKGSFTITYNAAGNVVEAGDTFGFILNLETDTSEVDNIILNRASFFYPTKHIGIESGDV